MAVNARRVVETVLGPLVLLLGLTSAWLAWDGHRQREENAARDRAISEAARAAAEESRLRTDCQLRFDRKVIRAVTITRRDSVRASAATQDVIQTVGRLMRHPPRTPAEQARQDAEFLAVFDRYDAAAEALAKTRRDNPFPTFPDCAAVARQAVAATPNPAATPTVP